MEYSFAGTKHSIKESKANTKCFNFLVLSQTTRGRYLCLIKTSSPKAIYGKTALCLDLCKYFPDEFTGSISRSCQTEWHIKFI